MSLSDHVEVNITQDSVGVTRPGYGLLLVLSHLATFPERVRFYTSVAGVLADFADGGPEHRAAQAVFAQSPKPSRIAIGRVGGTPPTQAYLLEVAAARASHTYRVEVDGPGFAEELEIPTGPGDLTFTTTHAADTLTIASHGFADGDGPFRVSSSGNDLPDGLAANTNYWVIVVDENTVQLASSRANALAGTEVTFDDDGTGTHTLHTATNDVVAAGLVEALNGVAGKNYTAATTGSNGSLDVTVTGDAAGDWFSVAVVDVADLAATQTHTAPAGLGTELSAILTENADWYGLHTLYNSEAYVLAASAWAEANGRLYWADISESATVTAAAGGSDTGYELFDDSAGRTTAWYHPRPASMLAAAVAATVFVQQPGSVTAKYRQPRGVAPVPLTATHRVNLRAKRVNTLERIAGVALTWEGVVSQAGYFVDQVRDQDYVKSEMEAAILVVLAGNTKVPYTERGLSLVLGAIRGVLQRSVSAEIYESFDLPRPALDAIDPQDKTDRVLPDIAWSAVPAGAVHAVKPVTGVVSNVPAA